MKKSFLKTKKSLQRVLFVISLFPTCGISQEADYEELNNIVVMEAENLNFPSSWKKASSSSGFSGSGYIVWENSDFFKSPGNGKIEVKIKINDPGKYLFQWRSQVGKGTDGTMHNDTWLRFADASDFYGERNGMRVYPVGTGKTPNPNGDSFAGWFKIFRSGNAPWSWQATTSDHDGRDIYVEFDAAGIYTMELSARSNFHIIDRIVLSKNYDNPTDLSIEETSHVKNTSSIKEIETNFKTSLKVIPNTLKSGKDNSLIINGLNPDFYSINIYDLCGKLISDQNVEVLEQNTTINIPSLISGYYIMHLKSAKVSTSVRITSQ